MEAIVDQREWTDAMTDNQSVPTRSTAISAWHRRRRAAGLPSGRTVSPRTLAAGRRALELRSPDTGYGRIAQALEREGYLPSDYEITGHRTWHRNAVIRAIRAVERATDTD